MHTPPFTIRFDDNNQELILVGSLRPQTENELDELRGAFEQALRASSGILYLNAKRLAQLNNVGFREIAALVRAACQSRPDLKISVVTSSFVGWSARKFSKLRAISDNIAVSQYDEEFYPGQGVLEDESFIPILRIQNRMTWRHERHMLPRHGLERGMVVADICCGIGDFAVLVQKEFAPSRLIALDHSQPSLAYARKVAADFNIKGIEYVHGDAANLILADNQFDFVTCRHGVQIFNQPELLLKELFRICKPGGRVYITNEKVSHCLGEPRAESIQQTYNEVARLFAYFEMDVEIGPKSRRYLMDTGFEDIRMESFMVTNLDGDPEDFAHLIETWENVFVNQMMTKRGDGPEAKAKMRQGLQDQIAAARHPKGYAGWPIWAASGRKP